MRQIFGYTAPEVNSGEQYVKFFQVFEVGSDYEVRMRDGKGEHVSLMMPGHMMDELTEAVKA